MEDLSEEPISPVRIREEEQDHESAKKLRSTHWNDFDRKRINGRMKAICKTCKKELNGETYNGTSHLKNHTLRCPVRKSEVNQISSRGRQTPTVTSSFDHEAARRELATMIILHEYPLSMVEHIGFKRYSNALQSSFKVVSRNTIKRDIFNMYTLEKGKTMQQLKNNESRVAITTDMWTASNQRKGYMAITAHYLDHSWVLQSRILRFAYVPCPHNTETIAKLLLECFSDWNICDKLSTITVDNCSTNKSVIDVLLEKIDNSSLLLDGSILHMRCCAHILNLIVKAGLEVLGDGLLRIRESVAYWSLTPKRVEEFREGANKTRVQHTRKLILDCKTRWNSTYEMLSIAISYKKVFIHFKQCEPQFKCAPLDNDWTLAQQIVKKLEIFYRVTHKFSGTQYPTTNLFFPEICQVKKALCDWLISPHEEIRTMASSMTSKFQKYWDDIHGVVAMATVLDPRYKMKLIEFYFPQIYGADNYRDHMDKVYKTCVDLVNQYQQNDIRQESSNLSFSISEANAMSYVDPLLQYDLFVSSSRTTDLVKTEFDIYLEEGVLPRTENFDILAWWKTNGIKYPVLQRIARDLLAIPVSTVASESAFSIGGRVVSKHRSRLKSSTVEALMCAQDWLWPQFDVKSVAKFPKYDISEFEDVEDIDSSDEDDGDEEDDQMTVDLS